MTKEQVKAFNDAVIAIIITLMVLDIRLPELTRDGVQDMLRHIFAYAISFFTIAIGWMNLSLLLTDVKKLTVSLIWLDLLLLFSLSLIPLPTQAIGERFFDPASHVFFGLVQVLVSIVFRLFINRIEPDESQITYRKTTLEKRLDNLTILIYALSMLLCYVSVYLSTLLFLIPPIVYYSGSRKRLERQGAVQNE